MKTYTDPLPVVLNTLHILTQFSRSDEHYYFWYNYKLSVNCAQLTVSVNLFKLCISLKVDSGGLSFV